MQGTVRNVVDFGAFVDIGVTEDGLVHISKLKKGYVKHPLDVVSSGDIVTVWVEGVDKGKGRISLTMLPPSQKLTTKTEGSGNDRIKNCKNLLKKFPLKYLKSHFIHHGTVITVDCGQLVDDTCFQIIPSKLIL